jgi:hypothetical protein
MPGCAEDLSELTTGTSWTNAYRLVGVASMETVSVNCKNDLVFTFSVALGSARKSSKSPEYNMVFRYPDSL